MITLLAGFGFTMGRRLKQTKRFSLVFTADLAKVVTTYSRPVAFIYSIKYRLDLKKYGKATTLSVTILDIHLVDVQTASRIPTSVHQSHQRRPPLENNDQSHSPENVP
jgi:hypothetical protein